MASFGKYILMLVVFSILMGQVEEVSASVKSAKLASPQCSKLIVDLQAMEKAQNEIMKSLVNNHETMAVSLENYSEEMQSTNSAVDKKLYAKELNNSAKAFRTRGVKAKQISVELASASNELIKKVNQCLAKK